MVWCDIQAATKLWLICTDYIFGVLLLVRREIHLYLLHFIITDRVALLKVEYWRILSGRLARPDIPFFFFFAPELI